MSTSTTDPSNCPTKQDHTSHTKSSLHKIGAGKKVLMVAPHPCFEARGTPMNVKLMCQTLTDLGFEVHLATMPFGDTDNIPGLVYHRVWRLPGLRRVPIGFSMAKMVYDVLIINLIAWLMLRHRFAAVHAVEEAAFFAVPMARLLGIPTIVDMDSDIGGQLAAHRSVIGRLLAKCVKPFERYVHRKSTCVITVCEALTEHVRTIAPGQVVFQIEDVPMPAANREPDAQLVSSLRTQFKLEDKKVIVYTGNLESYQGVEFLLESMPAVKQQLPDTRLVMVGGEQDQIEQLTSMARALDIDDVIIFAGKQPPETMAEFMALSDVLVSPRLEGQNTPLKIYTYMLSGKPIVATDLPTHTQVLDTSTAFLAKPTTDDFSAKIVECLTDTALAAEVAQAAKEKVSSDYSYESFQKKLSEVYEHITSGVVNS